MLNLSRQEQMRERYKTLRPGYRPALDIYRYLLDKTVTPQTRLLDVGCGPGGLVKQYVGTAQQVIGTDRYASHFHEPAEINTLVESDIIALPFAANTFDVVTCSWVLEHLHEPRPVFDELFRVMRPNGRLLFITPNKLNYAVWMRRLIPNRISKPIVKAIYGRDEDFINPTFYRANSYRALERQLTASGFTCERFEHISDPTYLALNEVMFRAAVALENVIDRFWPSSRVHLVGVYKKP